MRYKVSLFLFCLGHTLYAASCFCKSYTLDEIVHITKSENFSVQEKAQSYIRAYQNIKISIGMLAPSLNYNTVVAGIQRDYFSLVSSLCGFLFPSNWFAWKEKKYLFQAERLSYATLIANEINAIVAIYYRIHYLISLEEVYQIYLQDYEAILKLALVRFEEGEESIVGLLEIKNVLTRMRNDIISIQAEIRKTQYEFAKTVNLEEGQWQNVKIARIGLPDLSKKERLEMEEVKKKSVETSYELKQFDFLIKGAKWTILKRSFSFLKPSSEQEAAFGFGFKSYFKVGRSYRNELKIQKQGQESNIIYAANEATNNYNTNLDFYRENVAGLENTKLLKESLYLELQSGEDLKLERFILLLEELLSFHSKIIEAQHKFLISETQIERLSFSGPYYSQLLDLAPERRRGYLVK